MKSKRDILKWIAAHEDGEDGKLYLEEDVYSAMEEYAQQFKDGPQWIKASERLPEVFHIPITNKSIDKGSNRVPFRYDGELFAGRYIEEKWSIKDVFVTAEMDTVIQRKDFDIIFWLDEDGQRTPADDADYWKIRCEAAENLLAVVDIPVNKPDTNNDKFLLFIDRNNVWQESKYKK